MTLLTSKVCESRKGVWLGPGPEFKAYIVHCPEQVKLGKGPKTPLGLRNGVYEFNLRELVSEGAENNRLNALRNPNGIIAVGVNVPGVPRPNISDSEGLNTWKEVLDKFQNQIN